LTLPTNIYSIDFDNINSESVAINSAFITKIISDFCDCEIFFPTSSGKMSSGVFSFMIETVDNQALKIDVENSQIEIDAAFESNEKFVIIEAKNYMPIDFNIRQLFYPVKCWEEKLSGIKKIIPVFLTYSNGLFCLYEFRFNDLNEYNSIEIVKVKKYMIQSEKISIDKIIDLSNKATYVLEKHDIPFPQADMIERVMNLCEILLQHGVLAKQKITNEFGFDPRQTAYYCSAGMYLGLIEKTEIRNVKYYELSKLGKEIFKLPLVNRNLEIIKLVLCHKVFNEVLKMYLDNSKPPSKEKIVEVMKKSGLNNIQSNSTYFRRSSSVIRWIEWVISNITID
jgi:hypothetical protein